MLLAVPHKANYVKNNASMRDISLDAGSGGRLMFHIVWEVPIYKNRKSYGESDEKQKRPGIRHCNKNVL